MKFEDLAYESSNCVIVAGVFRAKQVGPKHPSIFAVTDPISVAVLVSYRNCFTAAMQKGRFLRKLLSPAEIGGPPRGSLSPIGINTVSKFPARMAAILGYPAAMAKLYTSHALRRTGATFLADGGCTLFQLKSAGGWASSKVAEHYIEESMHNKRTIGAEMGLFSSETFTAAAHTPPPPAIPPQVVVNVSLGDFLHRATGAFVVPAASTPAVSYTMPVASVSSAASVPATMFVESALAELDFDDSDSDEDTSTQRMLLHLPAQYFKK